MQAFEALRQDSYEPGQAVVYGPMHSWHHAPLIGGSKWSRIRSEVESRLLHFYFGFWPCHGKSRDTRVIDQGDSVPLARVPPYKIRGRVD